LTDEIRVNFLFWLSIVLWLVALVSYALIVSGKERLERKHARVPVFIPFEALFHSTSYSRSIKYLYRTLFLSAIGAMVTGGFYLLTRT
jgi:hypothetical protein